MASLFVPFTQFTKLASLSKVEKALLPTKYLDEITAGIGKGMDFLSDTTQKASNATRKAISEMIELMMLSADKFKNTIDDLIKKIFEWLRKNGEKIKSSISAIKTTADHFNDIARFRKSNALPEFAEGIKDSGTVAKVYLSGKNIYGLNSGLSQQTLVLRRKWFDILNKYFVPPRNHLGRMRFMNHAEAHALIAAHEMLGTLPSKVTIYVDRITCPFCRNELKYLLKELQIEELKIVNSLTDEILILNPTK